MLSRRARRGRTDDDRPGCRGGTSTDDANRNRDQAIAEELVDRARAEGSILVGPGGLLGELAKRILKTALEVEMDEHLGYSKHDRPAVAGQVAQRTRSKTVITEIGAVSAHLVEAYGTHLSRETISEITDAELDDLDDVDEVDAWSGARWEWAPRGAPS
jgi:hypothetical protein